MHGVCDDQANHYVFINVWSSLQRLPALLFENDSQAEEKHLLPIRSAQLSTTSDKKLQQCLSLHCSEYCQTISKLGMICSVSPVMRDLAHGKGQEPFRGCGLARASALATVQGAVRARPHRHAQGEHLVPAAAGEAEPGPGQAEAPAQGQEQRPHAGIRAAACGMHLHARSSAATAQCCSSLACLHPHFLFICLLCRWDGHPVCSVHGLLLPMTMRPCQTTPVSCPGRRIVEHYGVSILREGGAGHV